MKRKKVLIITYYWPPAGGIVVLRCLKIAKYLRDFGWEPIIFTAENPYYTYVDYTNEKDIPKGIEIIKQKGFELEGIFKKIAKKDGQSINNVVFSAGKKSWFVRLGIWVRANFFIPDAKALWIRPSVHKLSKYLQENKVDAIFSDGPPHTNTFIAQRIAEKFNIPWLSDYQDPWTQVDYYQKFNFTKWADKKHKRLEQKALKTARKVVSASPSFSKGLEELGAKNTGVIYYGYDEDDFKDIHPNLDKKFTMVHAGILAGDRLPENLLQAVKELTEENKVFKDDFRLKLIGSVEDGTLEIIKQSIPADNLDLAGIIPRKEVLQQICNAQVLLNLVNKINSKGRIPGKIYEYFRARRPIISLGDTEGDVAKLIEETKSGACFEYTNKQDLKKHILQLFNAYKENKLEATKGDISEFSNRNQTQKVAGYLDEIIH